MHERDVPGVKFETLKSRFKITLLFHQGTSIRGFASKCTIFNTRLVTGPENVPYADLSVHFSTEIVSYADLSVHFQSGKCSLSRPQRALFSPEDITYADVSVHFSVRKMFTMLTSACIFSPENVPYADLSVHFSVRKMFPMLTSACTFQSRRCMGLGHDGVKSYPC